MTDPFDGETKRPAAAVVSGAFKKRAVCEQISRDKTMPGSFGRKAQQLPQKVNRHDHFVFLLDQVTVAAMKIHLNQRQLGRNKTENSGILFLKFGWICSKMKVLLHGGSLLSNVGWHFHSTGDPPARAIFMLDQVYLAPRVYHYIPQCLEQHADDGLKLNRHRYQS